jgi:hypothetical protein
MFNVKVMQTLHFGVQRAWMPRAESNLVQTARRPGRRSASIGTCSSRQRHASIRSTEIGCPARKEVPGSKQLHWRHRALDIFFPREGRGLAIRGIVVAVMAHATSAMSDENGRSEQYLVMSAGQMMSKDVRKLADTCGSRQVSGS